MRQKWRKEKRGEGRRTLKRRERRERRRKKGKKQGERKKRNKRGAKVEREERQRGKRGRERERRRSGMAISDPPLYVVDERGEGGGRESRCGDSEVDLWLTPLDTC